MNHGFVFGLTSLLAGALGIALMQEPTRAAPRAAAGVAVTVTVPAATVDLARGLLATFDREQRDGALVRSPDALGLDAAALEPLQRELLTRLLRALQTARSGAARSGAQVALDGVRFAWLSAVARNGVQEFRLSTPTATIVCRDPQDGSEVLATYLPPAAN